MSRKFRPGLWPTLGMVAGLAILLTLGTWQLNRFQEKSERESRRDAQLEEPPVPLEVADTFEPAYDYRIVQLEGSFDDDALFLFKFRVRDSVPGYWLGQAFHGDDGTTVLVNRGWIPFEEGFEIAREIAAEGPATVEGLVFSPDEIIPDETTRSEIAPGELPEISAWNSYDISGIYARLQVDAPRPTIVVASPESSGSPYPVASYDYVVKPYLTSEKHLGYCVTWYTLAAALILMWIAYGYGYLGSFARHADGSSPLNAPT